MQIKMEKGNKTKIRDQQYMQLNTGAKLQSCVGLETGSDFAKKCIVAFVICRCVAYFLQWLCMLTSFAVVRVSPKMVCEL